MGSACLFDFTFEAMGDSITAGTGDPSNGGYRMPLLLGFPTAQSVGPVNTPAIGARFTPNAGYPGHNTTDLLSYITTTPGTIYSDYKADVVNLMIGVNNYSGVTAAQGRDDIVAIIAAIHATRPSAMVFCMPALNSSSSSTDLNFYTDALDALVVPALSGLPATSNTYLVPRPFLQDSEFFDGLHPNTAGYAKVAAAFSYAWKSQGLK